MPDLSQRNLPDWLYHLLPYLYGAAGLVTMLVLRNALAIFSGGLLITAGVLVWFTRRSYREAAMARHMQSRTDPGVIDIVWRPEFNSGSARIDDQHRALFAVANRLTDEITNHEQGQVIKETLRELIQEIQAHFKTEEELLEKVAPGMVGPHKLVHARLLKEIGEILDRVTHGLSSLRDLIGFVIYDVITDHLTKEDTKLFPMLKGGGG